MVTMEQIQRGAMRFIENDFAPHFTDIKTKVFLGGTSTLVAAALPNIAERYKPVLEMMDIMQGELFDIDAAYSAYAPLLGNDKLDFVLPVLGKVYISKSDLDKLMKFIKEA